MNIQAMMKQAQKLQKDVENVQKELEKTLYSGKSGFVNVEMYGSLEVNKITIEEDDLSEVEKDMLEDMIQLAMEDVLKKIKNDKNEKLGKFGQGMQGLL